MLTVHYTGAVISGVNARRGTIIDSEVHKDEFTAMAEVALNDIFGYSSQLRGATQGKGKFSIEYKVRALSAFLIADWTRGIGNHGPHHRITCQCSQMYRLSCKKHIASLCHNNKK
jgi:hypothetical protein